jgi:hypothetical protein
MAFAQLFSGDSYILFFFMIKIILPNIDKISEKDTNKILLFSGNRNDGDL